MVSQLDISPGTRFVVSPTFIPSCLASAGLEGLCTPKPRNNRFCFRAYALLKREPLMTKPKLKSSAVRLAFTRRSVLASVLALLLAL